MKVLPQHMYVNSKKDFHTKQLVEGGDLEVHLTRLRNSYEKLLSLGANIDEDELVDTTLNSLPESYETVTIVFGLAKHGTLKWKELVGLKLHAIRKENKVTHIVIIARPSNLFPNNQNCTFCKRIGHLVEFYWRNPTSKSYGKGLGTSRSFMHPIKKDEKTSEERSHFTNVLEEKEEKEKEEEITNVHGITIWCVEGKMDFRFKTIVVLKRLLPICESL